MCHFMWDGSAAELIHVFHCYIGVEADSQLFASAKLARSTASEIKLQLGLWKIEIVMLSSLLNKEYYLLDNLFFQFLVHLHKKIKE